MRQIILFAFLLQSSFLLLSQHVIDDFNDNLLTGWSPANADGNVHTLTAANGELRVDFSIANPNAFPNTVKSFPAPVDLSVFSKLTVKVRTSTPLAQISNIRFDLIDAGGLSTSLTPFILNSILTDGLYHTYEFDFKGKWRHLNGSLMDSTQITTLLMFINVGTEGNPGGTGTIYIDDLVMDVSDCAGVVIDNKILDDFECQRNLTGFFTSGALSLVGNPDTSTFNTSPTAGKYVRSNAAFDVFIGNFPGGGLNLSLFNKLKIQTLAPAGTHIQVSLQDAGGNQLAGATRSVTTPGQWEELVFDLSASAAVTGITKMVLLVNPGIAAIDSLYLDNIRMDSSAVALTLCSSTPTDNKILDDFECQRNLVNLFTSGTLSLVENPDVSTFNTSATSGKYIRSNAAFDVFIGNFPGGGLDLSLFNKIKIQTLAPAGTNIQVSFQDAGGNQLAGAARSVTTPGQWEELVFDLSASAAVTGITKMVLLVNPGIAAIDSLYLDNIRMDSSAVALTPCSSTPTNNKILDDFECQRNLVGLFTSGTLSLVENPDVSTFNTSATSGKYIRSDATFDVFIGNFPGGGLDLSLFNKVKVQTLAPAGTNIQVSLQDGAGNTLASANKFVTTPSEWEELVFDFSASAAVTGITKMVLLVNPGIAAIDSLYLDNIRMDSSAVALTPCSGTPIDNSILDDFECQRNLVDLFTSGTLSLANNPNDTGINPSKKSGKYLRSNNNFDLILGNFSGAGLDLNEFNLVHLQLYARIANVPVQITLNSVNGGQLINQTKISGPANTWSELVFDLSSLGDSVASSIVFLIMPGAILVDTFYLDNLRLGTLDPCDSVATDNTIIEDFDCQRNLAGVITSGSLELIANPEQGTSNPSVNVGRYIRTSNLQDLYQGNFATGLQDLSVNNQLKLQVYAPLAGFPVKVTLRDLAGNDLVSAQRIARFAGKWEELSFDFASAATVPNVGRMVLTVNPGFATADTFLLDNIRWAAPAGQAVPCANVPFNPNTLEDFECQRHLSQVRIDGVLDTVANPSIGTANASAISGKYLRAAKADDAIQGRFMAGNLALNVMDHIRLQIMAPAAGLNVELALMDHLGIVLGTQTATIANANAWEDLDFNFSALATNPNIRGFALRINPGSAVAGTYYLDNFRLSSGSTAIDPAVSLAAFRYYPNPATDQVGVEFELNAPGKIQIDLQDLSGRRVAMLLDETRGTGLHKLNADMPAVANGIYFIRITTPGGTTTGKLIIRR